jgi:flagellar P-ring protein precursor FlgI
MLKRFFIICTAFMCFYCPDSKAGPMTSRIKDIVSFQGVRDNQLVGYGLVIGLNGTGDSLRKSIFTKESLISMLDRMGINIREAGDIDTKNIAAVMVTATLPAFSRHGSKIDVVVSAMGDAKNLMGGTLLVTPLVGADGEVYAVAQGPVATSGFTAQGKAGSVSKGVPTSGRIANGAIVEKEIGYELAQLDSMNLSLRNPDFTTAQRIEHVINTHTGQPIAKAMDGATVHMKIPSNFDGDRVALLTRIEQLEVVPDQPAKVVVDDRDGVIVMGENTKISTVAVSHGSLSVRITEEEQVSQPNSFTTGVGANVVSTNNTTTKTTQDAQGSLTLADGALSSGTATSVNKTQEATTNQTQSAQTAAGATTQKVDRTTVDVQEEKSKMGIVQANAGLQDLVDSLNALGASPRDMITIIQSIKAAGALQASIEVI